MCSWLFLRFSFFVFAFSKYIFCDYGHKFLLRLIKMDMWGWRGSCTVVCTCRAYMRCTYANSHTFFHSIFKIAWAEHLFTHFHLLTHTGRITTGSLANANIENYGYQMQNHAHTKLHRMFAWYAYVPSTLSWGWDARIFSRRLCAYADQVPANWCDALTQENGQCSPWHLWISFHF